MIQYSTLSSLHPTGEQILVIGVIVKGGSQQGIFFDEY